jgi:hypothetical protein
MTDTTSTPTVNPDWEAWQAQARERDRLAKDVLPANKTALFDVLAAAGIGVVTVRFDGYGDSGQIEDIEAHADDTAIALPPDQIDIAEPLYDGSGLERSTLSVRDAIEKLAYAFLEETHGGWENNEGAYGDFTFDVESRTITLEYNERMMTSEYSQHAF